MINPTSPQLWHRMRVKVGGTARTEKFPAEADLRVPARGVLRGRAARRAHPHSPADSIANMRVLDAIYVAAGMTPRGT